MADLSHDEFLKMLDQEPSAGDVASRAAQAGFSAPRGARATTFEQRYSRPGVEFNTQTGAPPLTRIKLSFAPDDATRVAMLQQSFKGSTIEPIEDNQFIIRNVVDPDSQKVVDLLVDERQFSAKDLADLANVIPEMLGAYIAIRGGRGRTEAAFSPGRGRVLAESALGATGAQTAAALADASARLTSGQKVQPLEILERREKMAVGEAFLGGAMGMIPALGASVSQRVAAPRSIVQERGLDARERLAKATGIRVRMSFAEETGSPNLLRAEAIAEKSPTGGAFLKAQQAAGVEDMRAIQRELIGESPFEPRDASERAVQTLRDLANTAESNVEAATQAVASRAANEIASAIGDATGLQRSVMKGEAGTAIRDSLSLRKKAFDVKSAELYNAVGADPLIPIGPVTQELKAIEKELTKARVIGENELISGFDEFGPISAATTTEGREIVREFVPEGMSRFLSGVGKLDQQTPLSELRALRTRINDAKKQSEILPGVTTRMLSRFSAAISRAIDEAAPKLEDPGVVDRLRNANTFYRQIEQFEPKGVVEILADPDQIKLGNFAIVNQAIRDPDQYFRIKKALTTPITAPDGGAVSPADVGTWNLFKRAAITEIEEAGKLAGSGKLASGKKMLDVLSGFEPEVLNDLFGGDASRAIKGMRMSGALEGKVDLQAFMDSLSKGTFDASLMQRLVDEQKKLDGLYRENVIKRFVKGEIDSTAIEPGEFVDRFIDTARDEGELARVMSRLSGDPDLVKSIRSRTVENLFRKAAHKPSPEDIARGLGGDPAVMVDPARMFKELTSQQEKLQTVLGVDQFNLLQDYLRVAGQKAVKENVAQTVGGLVGGSLMNSIMTLDLKKVPAHIKYAVLGKLLSSPELSSALRRGRNADPTAMARSLIVSAPFIEGVMEDYGRGPGTAMLRVLGNALGLTENQATSTSAPEQREDLSRDEFLRALDE